MEPAAVAESWACFLLQGAAGLATIRPAVSVAANLARRFLLSASGCSAASFHGLFLCHFGCSQSSESQSADFEGVQGRLGFQEVARFG